MLTCVGMSGALGSKHVSQHVKNNSACLMIAARDLMPTESHMLTGADPSDGLGTQSSWQLAFWGVVQISATGVLRTRKVMC